MFSITFTGNEGAADRLMAFKPLPIIVAESVRGIRENTAKGVDVHGSTFKPLTKQRTAWRRKRSLRVDPTNLRVKTEHSLLDTLGEQSSGVITVEESKQPQAQGLSRKFEFIGMTHEAEQSIIQNLDREFERVMR